MKRVKRLAKRYRGYGLAADKADILARCVVEKRGGYGLFRSFGVPVKGLRKAGFNKIVRR